MALTYRQTKGTALTIEELDANFQYFTGSHSITGSLTIAGTSSLIDFENGSTIQPSGSTLQINPNINLGTDQYIVLDPTAPNHIHIRAGGAIDSSSAHLYLGGEKANVIVTDSNHQVQINATAADSSSLIWIFDNEGNTLFPTLTTPRGDINSGDLTTQTLKLGNGTDQAVISTPDGTAGYPISQRLVINPGQGSGSSEGGDIYLWAGRGGVEGGSGGDIKVRGGYGPASGSGGYVRIEGGNTDDGYAGFIDIRGGDSITGAGGSVDIRGGFGNGNTQNGNVLITTYNTSGSAKNWEFSTEGITIIPDVLQLTVRTTNPASPVEGMIMASGSAGSSKLYYYDGSAWTDLTA